MDITKDELLQHIDNAVKSAVAEVSVPKAVMTPEEKEAEKEVAGKFNGFGDYLSAIYKIRQFGVPDNRLVFVDSKGQHSKAIVNAQGKATLVEGTDSAGGYVTAN